MSSYCCPYCAGPHPWTKCYHACNTCFAFSNPTNVGINVHATMHSDNECRLKKKTGQMGQMSQMGQMGQMGKMGQMGQPPCMLCFCNETGQGIKKHSWDLCIKKCQHCFISGNNLNATPHSTQTCKVLKVHMDQMSWVSQPPCMLCFCYETGQGIKKHSWDSCIKKCQHCFFNGNNLNAKPHSNQTCKVIKAQNRTQTKALAQAMVQAHAMVQAQAKAKAQAKVQAQTKHGVRFEHLSDNDFDLGLGSLRIASGGGVARITAVRNGGGNDHIRYGGPSMSLRPHSRQDTDMAFCISCGRNTVHVNDQCRNCP